MDARFTFPVGRIARIPIRMHVLLPAYALFMFIQVPGYARPEVVGLVLRYFGVMVLSVLLHEFGHAFTGRHHGARDQEIGLRLLGGVTTQTDTSGRNPRIQVALAGVAVNLLLALAAGAAMALRGETLGGIPSLHWGKGLLRLTWDINLALAAFNLLPGLPFDGGAAVEPLLWRRFGRTRARLAVIVSGAIISAALFVGGLASGSWLLAIIGGVNLLDLQRMYHEARQKGVEDPVLFGVHDFSNGYSSLEDSRPAPDRAERLAAKAEEKARRAAETGAAVALREREDARGRLDRLLDRIAAEGISSLSPEERVFLNEESRRLRGKKAR